MVFSLCVGHDAEHGSFKGTGGERHHFIQDPQRYLLPAFIRSSAAWDRAKDGAFIQTTERAVMKYAKKLLHTSDRSDLHFID